MREPLFILTAAAVVVFFAFPASAELGSDNPTDVTLLTQREVEAGCDTSTTPPTCPSGTASVFNSGTFDIASPPAGTTFMPAKRVRRDKFGVVGPFTLNNGLTEKDLDAIVYPDATVTEKDQLVEGLQFFTMFHTAAQGLGPTNNQPACIGCHLNAAEAIKSKELLRGQDCLPPNLNSTCSNVSNVTRAARSTPTNFEFTSLDPDTGGGRAPDNLDALTNTGRTAAFTTFGDFDPNHADAASNPTGIGFFDPLDGTTANIVTGTTAQPFGGFVQHHRPAGIDCLTKPLPPLSADDNLPNGNSGNPNNFYRSVGERAGPPYIGRGLMEAVPTVDIRKCRRCAKRSIFARQFCRGPAMFDRRLHLRQSQHDPTQLYRAHRKHGPAAGDRDRLCWRAGPLRLASERSGNSAVHRRRPAGGTLIHEFI
jgi:hypothetical protein